MLIDCDTCAVRGQKCHDCVIGMFLDVPPRQLELDGAEQDAIGSLVRAGLVPPLRLVALSGPADPERGIA